MCMSDECCKYAAQVHSEIFQQAHVAAMQEPADARRVLVYLRGCLAGRFQVSTLSDKLNVAGDIIYSVINALELDNDRDYKHEEDETYFFFNVDTFTDARVAELRQIINESDEEHAETLQELERAYRYIHSALQVIDGASLDSSTAVTIYTVRALLIAAVGGGSVQAVAS